MLSCCQDPLTIARSCAGSLCNNGINPKGGEALGEALKTNSTLQNLKSVAHRACPSLLSIPFDIAPRHSFAVSSRAISVPTVPRPSQRALLSTRASPRSSTLPACPSLLSIPADSACLLPHSLNDNFICHGGNMSGLIALCEVLKTNSCSLRELKYAPPNPTHDTSHSPSAAPSTLTRHVCPCPQLALQLDI